MRIGVLLFATDAAPDPAVVARRAEELGFYSFWVPEHPIIPVTYTSTFRSSRDGRLPNAYSRILDPFVALARASANTQTIKLGTGVCLVPERNPLLLAKEVATLDWLSGGRFIFGVGAGWLKEETEIMGGDFPHRWTQTREAVMAMKELWTKDEAQYHGQYYDFPAVRSFPKPLQRPHPPIFLGGTAKNVLQRVVEWGDGWMPGARMDALAHGAGATVAELREARGALDELARRAGRDPRSIEILAFGFPGRFRTREEIEEVEEASVEHLTIWLESGAGAVAEIEELARRILP